MFLPISTPPVVLSLLRRRNMFDDPHFSMVGYIGYFLDSLDGSRAAVMRLYDGAQTVCDVRHVRECDKAVGACKKRWRHWSGCNPPKLNFFFPNTDLQYVRCYEKAGYTVRDTLARFLPTFATVIKPNGPFFGWFSRHFASLRMILRHSQLGTLGKDMGYELRMNNSTSSIILGCTM